MLVIGVFQFFPVMLAETNGNGFLRGWIDIFVLCMRYKGSTLLPLHREDFFNGVISILLA